MVHFYVSVLLICLKMMKFVFYGGWLQNSKIKSRLLHHVHTMGFSFLKIIHVHSFTTVFTCCFYHTFKGYDWTLGSDFINNSVENFARLKSRVCVCVCLWPQHSLGDLSSPTRGIEQGHSSSAWNTLGHQQTPLKMYLNIKLYSFESFKMRPRITGMTHLLLPYSVSE